MLPDNRERALLELYLAYRGLVQAAAEWEAASLQGRLVLLAGDGQNGTRFAAAGRIGGAATLLVLGSESEAKAAVRDGASDFLVHGLDEALRILKNEIRRQAPVGVCLLASPALVVRECVERGVQPDLLGIPPGAEQNLLLQRGARELRVVSVLREQEHPVVWSLKAGPVRLLEMLDRLAAASLVKRDGERLRWLQFAPVVLSRSLQRTRFLPMQNEEVARLLLALRRESEEATENLRVGRGAEQIWPPE